MDSKYRNEEYSNLKCITILCRRKVDKINDKKIVADEGAVPCGYAAVHGIEL